MTSWELLGDGFRKPMLTATRGPATSCARGSPKAYASNLASIDGCSVPSRNSVRMRVKELAGERADFLCRVIRAALRPTAGIAALSFGKWH